MEEHWILSNAFSACMDMIWFLAFILLMWSVTFINLQPKRQGLEHRHVPDGHDSQVQGMCAQSGRWQCNNSSSWGQQCPSLWAGGSMMVRAVGYFSGKSCWCLQGTRPLGSPWWTTAGSSAVKAAARPWMSQGLLRSSAAKTAGVLHRADHWRPRCHPPMADLTAPAPVCSSPPRHHCSCVLLPSNSLCVVIGFFVCLILFCSLCCCSF